jgi:serine/threonine-protein kinase
MAESHLEFTKPAHVVGRYALYGRLAAGGMATVHLGRMLEVDGTSPTVAVKRLHPQFCKDPEFVAMFIDEARLAARIKHPNVVETLDILTMGQELLLVMEYIRGECFSKLLRAARRKNLEPSIGVVGHIASGMLHGLHAAHEAKDDRGEPLNVVHRDISPQNVMIDADGAVKVLDFGVAKASARIQITRDGQMKGKLSYMSPEQLQGMPVDRRADVFACGVVLWEALTRRRLFVGEDASEVLRKILRDEVPRPSEFVPELTPDMDAVVLRALCKDPERRYQTAEDLAVDIENVIGLASANDVSAWIYSVAGEILTKRERLLQEIERLGAEGLPLPSTDPSAGGSVHGSITDSDTFQRIQSWAEREAARAADSPSRPSIELEEPGAEALPTVADARVESIGFPSGKSSPVVVPRPLAHLMAPLPGSEDYREAMASAPPVPLDDEEIAVDEVEEEATSKVELPVGAMLEPAAAVAPIFSHAPRALSEAARRQRRLVTMLSAAAVFGVLATVAVVTVQPVALTRSSSALRPDTTPGASAAHASPGAVVAANKPTVPVAVREEPSAALALKGSETAELPIGSAGLPAPATVSAAALSAAGTPERHAAASPAPAPLARATAPASASPGIARAGTSVDSSVDGSAANRVSLALTQQKTAAANVPKRATKHAQPAARRTRPALAPTAPRATAAAPAPAPASAKIDCKQPYWIDERGIRRLKLACLD